MLKKKRRISLDNLNLTNPQRNAFALLLSGQKNKYKKLLHETHERLHTITDPMVSFELWIDETGKAEFISHSCLEVTGYERQQLVDGQITIDRLIDKPAREDFLRDRKRVLEKDDVPPREYALRHRDGSLRIVAATWSAVTTHRGRVTGYRLGLRDITAQREAERRAARLAALLRRMIEADQAALLCSATGTILSANPAAELLFARGRGELSGCDAAHWLATGAFPAAAAGATGTDIELEILAGAKRRVPVHASIQVLDPAAESDGSLLLVLLAR